MVAVTTFLHTIFFLLHPTNALRGITFVVTAVPQRARPVLQTSESSFLWTLSPGSCIFNKKSITKRELSIGKGSAMQKIIGNIVAKAPEAESASAPIVSDYGRIGQKVVSDLFGLVENFNREFGAFVKLTWQQNNNCLVLDNSGKIKKSIVEQWVDGVAAAEWKLVVSKNRDASGNFLLTLQAVAKDALGESSRLREHAASYQHEASYNNGASLPPTPSLRCPVAQAKGHVGMGAASAATANVSAFHENVLSSANLFHGFGHNLLRLKSILIHGLLSTSEASARAVQVSVSHSGSFSGASSISMSTYCHRYGSFEMYSSGKLAVVVDSNKVNARFCHESGFPDEFLVEKAIEPSQFRGLFVPTESLDTLIGELEVGVTNGGSGNFLEVVKKYLDGIQLECGYSEPVQPILDMVFSYLEMDVRKKILDRSRRQEIESAVAQYTQHAMAVKLGIDKPRLIDVLRVYVPSDMAVYGSDGFPLQLASVA